MALFTITEDFSINEIEFDLRSSNPAACYDYLFKQKWPKGAIGLWRLCYSFELVPKTETMHETPGS